MIINKKLKRLSIKINEVFPKGGHQLPWHLPWICHWDVLPIPKPMPFPGVSWELKACLLCYEAKNVKFNFLVWITFLTVHVFTTFVRVHSTELFVSVSMEPSLWIHQKGLSQIQNWIQLNASYSLPYNFLYFVFRDRLKLRKMQRADEEAERIK